MGKLHANVSIMLRLERIHHNALNEQGLLAISEKEPIQRVQEVLAFCLADSAPNHNPAEIAITICDTCRSSFRRAVRLVTRILRWDDGFCIRHWLDGNSRAFVR